ncbi:MAG: MFS transporter [Bacteroidales bacterium]|nr:MFS transporter [Bacteroidales bacterium]MBN2820258.1 MFS transporter [Bacteroidales bacterium]
MLFRIYNSYIHSFNGLRKEVWYLALITLVNRAGTMVIPFLSLYLTEDLGFSLKNVGWVLTSFGLGSLLGSWLGGKLTDRFGFYPVIFWSLFLSGILFILLQFMHSFEMVCIGVFLVLVVADLFRPAAFVAINAYSKPKNRTRSVTLIRLAINLGFSLGPALGGLIIAKASYDGLFWIDGLTCILAGFLFFKLLDKKQVKKESSDTPASLAASPYRDMPYLLLLFIVFIIGTVFMQLFSSLPIFYRNIHFLSEDSIGLLLAMNGILIFAIEMPLIKHFEQPKYSAYRILSLSTLLIGLCYFSLNWTNWSGILVISMLFLTFGEMLNFPFFNRFALDRAERGKSGEYMALYTMAFSLSNVFGHNIGMRMVDAFGYKTTWNIFFVVLLVAVALIQVLKAIMKKEKNISGNLNI